jgi:hypothetical protein
MDGTHDTIADPADIVGRFMSSDETLWASFKHPIRDCVFEEAEAINEIGFLEHKEYISAQVKHYQDTSMPRDLGLPANTVILRRNCALTATLEAAWWEQICKFTSRDQLSLSYCMWRHHFFKHFAYIPGHWQRNDWVRLTQTHSRQISNGKFL